MSISSVIGQKQYAYAPEYPSAMALGSTNAHKASPASADNGADAAVTISAEARRLYAQSQIAVAQRAQLGVASGAETSPIQSDVQSALPFDQFVQRAEQQMRDYYGIEKNEPIVVDKFVEKADQALEAASARVRAKLANAGIRFNTPAEFSATGGVLQLAGHPIANEIEAVLNADPSLSRDLGAALAMKAHASALQRAAKFTEN